MQAKETVCKQKLRKLFKAFPSFLPPTQGIYSMSKKVCSDDSNSYFLLSLCKIQMILPILKQKTKNISAFEPHTLTRFLSYCLPFLLYLVLFIN